MDIVLGLEEKDEKKNIKKNSFNFLGEEEIMKDSGRKRDMIKLKDNVDPAKKTNNVRS